MSLPGADELFRTTGGMALTSSSPASQRRGANGEPRVPGPAGESDPAGEGRPGGAGATAPAEQHSAADPHSAEPSRGRSAEAEQAAGSMKGRRTQEAGAPGQTQAGGGPGAGQQRRRGRGANRRPSGRERHDEKITVYVSAEELMDLEHARLVLRGEHGLAVDRGRIVREAVAVVLADLESRGDASILVRRLRGR
ncbi:hypothetical protein [Streptomyces sp. NPDC088258]|uniref:hypothetical protein n=1 Tax=Streptomyces sp. NPDC088258 TaxID=3365849 RepID=UPI00381BB406